MVSSNKRTNVHVIPHMGIWWISSKVDLHSHILSFFLRSWSFAYNYFVIMVPELHWLIAGEQIVIKKRIVFYTNPECLFWISSTVHSCFLHFLSIVFHKSWPQVKIMTTCRYSPLWIIERIKSPPPNDSLRGE